jgi:hypothetical protein
MKIGELIDKPKFIVAPNAILNPTYVFGETINEELYEDITSNISWMTIGLTQYDYMYCRAQVRLRCSQMDLTDPKNIEELRVGSQYFCVNKEERSLVHSEEEQKKFWSKLILDTYNTRRDRWVKAKVYISYSLEPIDSNDLAIETEKMSTNFIEYGIETLLEWLSNEFTFKPYYTEERKNMLLSILNNGYEILVD